MQLDVRTILLLMHPDGRRVLLLHRSATKKLFPGLITGIGGKVELDRGEGADLEASVLRELREETGLGAEDVTDVRLRLSTVLVREGQVVVLLWFTGKLVREPRELRCTEGELAFFERDDLPTAGMIPTAREAIGFVMGLEEGDGKMYSGTYGADQTGLTVSDSPGGSFMHGR